MDDRRAMDAIYFRRRTGYQWHAGSATELCSSSSADGAMTKAPLGGKTTGCNPTDRGTRGRSPATKRSVLTEAPGVPVGLAVDGANRHDGMLLGRTLERIAVPRARPTPEHPQGLGLDTGYDVDRVYTLLREAGLTAHLRSRGEEAQTLPRTPGARARRWVVERTPSWMNRFRGVLVRWDKQTANDAGSLHLACAYIAFARAGRLG